MYAAGWPRWRTDLSDHINRGDWMKLLTGFFMAWGNFLALPCPAKKWDGDMKNAMLGFLPAIGLIIGVLWAVLCVFFVWIGTPFFLISFLIAFVPFALSGFLHLDGFMDCCDAIMSRRPLQEKQQILKDSHCGAFAVISLAFMVLAYFVCAASALNGGIDFPDLCMIPVASRAVAGLNVLLRKPIGHSQYAQGKGSSDDGQKKRTALAVAAQLVVFCGAGLFFANDLLPSAIVVGAVMAVTYVAAVYAKRQLGGMSGDIAGYSIVWGELAGIFAMLVM